MEANKIFVVIRAFLQGLIDSFRGFLTLYNIVRKIYEKTVHERTRKSVSSQHKEKSPTSKIGRRVLQCCMLNGGILWFSILCFDYVVLPFVGFVVLSLRGSSEASSVCSFLEFVFETFGVLPALLGSKLVNFFWFQDIADSAFRCSKGKSPSSITLSKFFADAIFSSAIQALFLLQIMFIGYIPMSLVGQILHFVHMSLLYSLYSFEYSWCKIGLELHKRLTFIEANWPYFMGFGLPLTVCTLLTSSFAQRACCFSVLFPFFIISANEAKPVTNVCFKLPLFSIAICVVNVFSTFVSWFHRSREKRLKTFLECK